MRMLIMPPLWLLVIIVGLPPLSETVYTTALPDIAQSLSIAHYMVEYTLTIYLFGFALGTLFWGKASDKYGRKPALLAGLILYIIGCAGCFYASTFMALMVSRFIQAFGGSTGSVLGQAICRDAFTGPERGKIFSIICSALAFSPAIGPVIGGAIAQVWGWPAIFLLLTIVGIIVTLCALFWLPETHTPGTFSLRTIQKVALLMVKDKKVLAAGLLVALCNGISFSYFAEGPFYIITKLGLSPFLYGLSFIGFALAGIIGSYTSKKMLDKAVSPYTIMQNGSRVVLCGSAWFISGIALAYALYTPALLSITLTLSSMMVMLAGIGMIIPNILSLALEEYQTTIGTASSLFGFYYYCLISVCTFIMGMIHNGTLWPMPLFFGGLALGIYTIVRFINRSS